MNVVLVKHKAFLFILIDSENYSKRVSKIVFSSESSTLVTAKSFPSLLAVRLIATVANMKIN